MTMTTYETEIRADDKVPTIDTKRLRLRMVGRYPSTV